ncbi:hypothetical protein ACIPVB_01140 [Microbacterium sp. NPDC090007]|uniref:hypothetical protein n=1 Tax=Microbacterium sp. NPDC090007 TaxID=3364204 RepID=UPI00381F5E3E
MAYLVALGLLSLIGVVATALLIRTDGYGRIPTDPTRAIPSGADADTPAPRATPTPAGPHVDPAPRATPTPAGPHVDAAPPPAPAPEPRHAQRVGNPAPAIAHRHPETAENPTPAPGSDGDVQRPAATARS